MTDPRRDAMALVFDALGSEESRGFARFLRGDDAGASPCWGTIAEQFDAFFPEDGARLDLLEALLDLGDREMLLLFLDASRGRPRILAALAQTAARLPPAEQRALVTVVATSAEISFPPAARAALHPAARELLDAPEDARRGEHQLFAARVAALRAMRIRGARTALAATDDGAPCLD